MKKLFFNLFMGCILFAACDDNTPETPDPAPVPPDGGETPPSVLTGYADPGGVLILSGGVYTMENAFLTFIAPDGTVENHVYATTNGMELGNDGVGLYMCEGKQYILCNDWRTAEGKENEGLLTIADAETLQKEKSFLRKDMVFQHPVNEELEEVEESISGIAVLDECNIFIFAQGVLRFDSTTGVLTLVEGSYDIGNAGSANTVESIVTSRGAMVIGDCLYAAAGGFWSTTALLEFSKGKNEVNRRLELGRGDLISGMCLTDDGTLVVGTYTRGRNSGYLYFIDLENWQITKQKTIAANISPSLHENSGITFLDGYIYFTGAEETEYTSVLNTSLSRYSIETGKVENDIVDFQNDAPNANILDCNVVADPDKGYIYVATSDENWEGVVPESHILVYDCNGDTPLLVQDIDNVTHGVKGIYPLSIFSQRP